MVGLFDPGSSVPSSHVNASILKNGSCGGTWTTVPLFAYFGEPPLRVVRPRVPGITARSAARGGVGGLEGSNEGRSLGAVVRGWVGRQVEPSRRREASSTGLTFSHHRESFLIRLELGWSLQRPAMRRKPGREFSEARTIPI